MEAAFLDLEEDDDELRTIYIQNEDDEIISPFSGTNDIYVTYRPGIYGCMETDKEFKVVVIEEIEED